MSRITYYNKCRRRKIAYLGGKCVKCGTTEKLEFDHIDPSTKSFCVSKYMQSFTPKVIAELDKCQLLCKEHHKEKSILEGSVYAKKQVHGTSCMYDHHKCRCELCKEAQRLKIKKYRTKKRLLG